MGDGRRSRPGIAVTGVGAVTPLGNGARQLFEGWRASESGIVDGVARCAADWNPDPIPPGSVPK